MITNAIDDRPLPIYGNGKQERTWLHVEDHCSGIYSVLEQGRIGEIYNIGGVDVVENVVMARKVLKELGKPESLLSYVKDRPAHDKRYALSSTKIECELGWKPSVTLQEGLRQTVNWYRNNNNACSAGPMKDSGDNVDRELFRNMQKLRGLRIEHRDLDEVIARLSLDIHIDELQLKRLKKRKLVLKDQILMLESQLIPDLNA